MKHQTPTSRATLDPPPDPEAACPSGRHGYCRQNHSTWKPAQREVTPWGITTPGPPSQVFLSPLHTRLPRSLPRTPVTGGLLRCLVMKNQEASPNQNHRASSLPATPKPTSRKTAGSDHPFQVRCCQSTWPRNQGTNCDTDGMLQAHRSCSVNTWHTPSPLRCAVGPARAPPAPSQGSGPGELSGRMHTEQALPSPRWVVGEPRPTAHTQHRGSV